MFWSVILWRLTISAYNDCGMMYTDVSVIFFTMFFMAWNWVEF